MKKRIQDIPSRKKLLEDIKGFDNALSAEAHKLITLPDLFNDHFVEYGWIAYEDLDHRVVIAAIEKADIGDFETAEQLLVNHYDEAKLRYYLKHLSYIHAFKPRMRLLRLALEDYLVGRYHACIPVVLAQLDGAVADLCNLNFFAEGVDLNAWDSISAHNRGLTALAKVLGKERGKTRDEPISIPYRNGIVHGRDLGYDSQIVAAKAWAALFAVQDLATKSEQGRREPPPEDPPLTDEEERVRDETSRAEHERVLAWQPPTVVVGNDITDEGSLEAYPDGSPERPVIVFLKAWAKQRYGLMAECLVERQRTPIKKAAGRLRSEYETNVLHSFGRMRVKNSTPVGSTIVVSCEITAFEVHSTWEVTFQLLYESPGFTHLYGEPGGTWGINLISRRAERSQ